MPTRGVFLTFSAWFANILHMSETKIYEIGYLLLPTIAEEAVAEKVGNFRGTLERLSAEFISEEMPRMIRLAYPMEKVIENKKQKFDSAYFGWVKFALAPVALAELKKEFDQSKDVIRFLVIKTVREGVTSGRRAWKPKREQKAESAEPMTAVASEELDKKIEELAI